MKRIIYVILAVFMIFSFASCGGNSTKDRITEALGVDISDGDILDEFDDHGGFHGDGVLYSVVEFEDDSLAEKIEFDGSWKGFPLDETVQKLIYGVSYTTDDGVIQIGPYVSGGGEDVGKSIIPVVESGYYKLIDRHTGEGDILERASFNFTLAVYDTDNNTLYYLEFDT